MGWAELALEIVLLVHDQSIPHRFNNVAVAN